MLKEAVKQKLRLKVIGCHQGEYRCILTQDGLSLFCKEYGVKNQLNITT